VTRKNDTTAKRDFLLVLTGSPYLFSLFVLVSLALIFLIFRYVFYIPSNPRGDFFTFWLAGKMNWLGQNPYSSADWLAGHQAYGTTWIPNTIFVYPLPLARLLAPIGLLPLDAAYIVWDTISIGMIFGSIALILSRWDLIKVKHFILPLFLGALIFRPSIVTLRNGQISAILLFAVSLGFFLLEIDRGFWAGVVLGFCFVKPQVGVGLMAFVVFWLLIKRNWQGLVGVGVTATGLVLIGLQMSPSWISTFLTSGQQKMMSAFGLYPTTWGVSDYICKGQSNCTIPLSIFLCGILSAVLLFLLWRWRNKLLHINAIGLIVPVALLIAPYSWAYDQLLLLVPFAIITLNLYKRGSPYLLSALILPLLSTFSILLLFLANIRQDDRISILLPLIAFVLSIVLVLNKRVRKEQIKLNESTPSAGN
jgi:hypothetical protein